MSNLPLLWRELDRPFAGFGALNPLLRQFDDFVGSPKRAAFDYEETKDGFVLVFDVPGAERDKLNVEFHENKLIVSGEQKRHGPFKHSVELPEGIQATGIKADYDDGVLTVTVPKAPESQPVKIAIGLGKAS